MSDSMIKDIADKADVIVAGFAFTKIENGRIRVLNLEKTNEVCVLAPDGNMLETTMDDATVCLVQAYYLKNKEFMEGSNA